jgi:hypothetical protein
METKKLINREKMTNATFKRLLRYADANDIFELVALAKAEGARLGRSDVDKKTKATQYFIDKYNDEVMTKRELIKEEKKKEKEIKKVKAVTTEIKDNILTAYNQIKKAFEDKKNIQIMVLDGDNVIRNLNYDFKNDNRSLFNMWAKIKFDLIPDTSQSIFDVYPNSRMFLVEGKTLLKTKSIQTAFFEGKLNCVMMPIIKFIENKIEDSKTKKTIQNYQSLLKKAILLETKYHNIGVNNEALIEISNTLQLDLIVNLPFQKEYMKASSNKKALRTFNYINTRINHVEFDELTHNGEEKIVSLEEMKKIKIQLDKNDVFNTYKKSNLNICEINTATTKYKLDNKYQETILEFEIETDLINSKICDIHNKDVSEFIRQGVHFNETIDVNTKEENYYHIDMKQAYLKYRMCKYYKGFLKSPTDLRETNKIVDVGYYQIKNLKLNGRIQKWNKVLNCYNDNIYPSPELEMLLNEGCTFDIIAGSWGSNIDLPLDEYKYEDIIKLKDENDIRYYCKYIGSMFCQNLTKSFYMKSNNDFINHLQNEIDADFSVFNDEVKVSYNKQSNYHLSHICGFITSYMRLNMLEQLFEFEPEDICKIVVDGIFHTKKDVNLKNCFRVEEKEMTMNIAGDSYISNNKLTQKFNVGKFKEHNLIEVHRGVGGGGKTHNNLIDIGNVGLQYFAPSWKLARNKEKEYGIRCNTTAKITTTDPNVWGFIKKTTKVLLVDECSMLSNEEKEIIIKNFEGCKILFCGDMGYQLPNFTGTPFNINNMKVIDYETNYRVKCDKLAVILKEIRRLIKGGINPRDYVLSNFKIVTEMNYNYLEDMILCSTHINKDKYTEQYKHLNKYYITKSDRIYGRGEIYYEKPNTTDCEIRHAYTIHSIQGETAKGQIFIEMAKMYNPQMIYTAISRSQYHNQINIIL